MRQEYSRVPLYTLTLVRDREVEYPLEKVGDSYEAVSVLRAYLEDQDCEHLVVLMIDAANNMIGLHDVAVGGIGGLNVRGRDVFKAAIVARASGIILGHNHPSGNVSPSHEDVAFTKQLVKMGKLLGVTVLDHIIISSGIDSKSMSFVTTGLMDQLIQENES